MAKPAFQAEAGAAVNARTPAPAEARKDRRLIRVTFIFVSVG
jgi:hypothetical protein